MFYPINVHILIEYYRIQLMRKNKLTLNNLKSYVSHSCLINFSKLSLICHILWLLFFCSSLGYSARINEIIIQSSADTFVPNDLVLAHLILRTGEEFSPEKLSEAIKTLYATKKLDDIEATVIPISDDLVNILFVVTPRPTVDEITFDGNKLITTKKLKTPLSQKEGEAFDEKTTLTGPAGSI